VWQVSEHVERRPVGQRSSYRLSAQSSAGTVPPPPTPCMTAQQIVQKRWHYCDVLRDDGLSHGDYVEQLTYLLFFKMAHERTQAP
jgi:hypothetical protein